MDRATEFTLTDVRCFEGEQRARLAPITLLVGENSTGKTTFLGCYDVMRRLLSGRARSSSEPDFDREPFSMGSFSEIVRSRRGSPGRIESFAFEIRINPAKQSRISSYSIKVRFSGGEFQPAVSSVRYDFGGGDFLELNIAGHDELIVKSPDNKAKVSYFGSDWQGFWLIFRGFYYIDRRSYRPLQPIFKYLSNFFPKDSDSTNETIYNSWKIRLRSPVAIAPLRSKPKRTYDPVRETASPDGDHIPMLMMRLDRTDKEEWKSLRDGIVDFGRQAGMFSDIAVKRHGRNMSDPFQLRVKARSGTPANLVDVGYGVSQSLPIVVDVCREKERTFLLQQPEVHLHPRAQAELASLFVESFKKNGNEFMIETHSDQIVDRVRILVQKGEIAPDDVSILYFEPKRNAVQIHSLTLDEHGNLENAPPGYRDFFLKETDRLLGFDE